MPTGRLLFGSPSYSDLALGLGEAFAHYPKKTQGPVASIPIGPSQPLTGFLKE